MDSKDVAPADFLADSLEDVRRKIQTVDLYLQMIRARKRIGASASFQTDVHGLDLDGLFAMLGSLQAEESSLLAMEVSQIKRHGVKLPDPVQRGAHQ